MSGGDKAGGRARGEGGGEQVAVNAGLIGHTAMLTAHVGKLGQVGVERAEGISEAAKGGSKGA